MYAWWNFAEAYSYFSHHKYFLIDLLLLKFCTLVSLIFSCCPMIEFICSFCRYIISTISPSRVDPLVWYCWFTFIHVFLACVLNWFQLFWRRWVFKRVMKFFARHLIMRPRLSWRYNMCFLSRLGNPSKNFSLWLLYLLTLLLSIKSLYTASTIVSLLHFRSVKRYELLSLMLEGFACEMLCN